MADFDNDDCFFLEALDEIDAIEAKNSQNLTPKISESCTAGITHKKESETQSNTNGNLTDKVPKVSENDFRAKLMKSLMISKNKISNNKLESSVSTCSAISSDLLTSQKRKLDINDSLADDGNDLGMKVARYPQEPNNLSFNERCIEKSKTTDNISVLDSPNSALRRPTNGHKVFSPLNSVIRKRKFPGPAGLLPTWDPKSSLKFDLSNEDISKYETSSEDSVCSQTTAQDFASDTWKQMLADLDSFSKSSQHLFQNNIKWILRRASLKGAASIRKIPFLVVMVKSIDLAHVDATAVFQDESGEIQGTIAKGVLEKYAEHISCGTVFTLKDLTILSPASYHPGTVIMGHLRRHYLNITLNSIVSIYSMNDAGEIKKITVVEITKTFIDNLLRAQEEGLKERQKVLENEEHPNPSTEVCLFPGISSEMPQNTSKSQSTYRKFPSFKNPLADTRPPGPNQMVTGKTSKEQIRPVSIPRPPQPQILQPRQPVGRNVEINTPPAGRNLINPTKSFNNSSPSSKTNEGSFQSFIEDDDELDNILASINTDSL